MTFNPSKPYVLKPWVGKENPEPGTWVQLTVLNNEVVAKECTDPRVPFGILVDTVIVNGILMARIDVTIGGVWETDVYDTAQRYPVNAILFVNDGKLTTSEGCDGYDGYNQPGVGVGIVVSPPTALNPTLEFLRF